MVALLGSDHPAVATIESNLGLALQDQGKLAEAEQLQREVLAKRRKLLGPEHPYMLKSLASLGWVLRDRGKLTEARRTLEECVALGHKIQDPVQDDLVLAEVDLAVVLGDLGKVQPALDLLAQAQAAREQTLGTEHPGVAQIYVRRADILLSSGSSARLETWRNTPWRSSPRPNRGRVAMPSSRGASSAPARRCRATGRMVSP